MIKVKAQQSPSGKIIYTHLENFEKRGQLLQDCISKKITEEEMRKRARKIPCMLSRFEVEVKNSELYQIVE